MLINVCFDLHASIIECDVNDSIENINNKLENWLYEVKEDNNGRYIQVKESLNIDVLDISVIVRFFSEVYPNSKPKIKVEKTNINKINDNLPTINL